MPCFGSLAPALLVGLWLLVDLLNSLIMQLWSVGHNQFRFSPCSGLLSVDLFGRVLFLHASCVFNLFCSLLLSQVSRWYPGPRREAGVLLVDRMLGSSDHLAVRGRFILSDHALTSGGSSHARTASDASAQTAATLSSAANAAKNAANASAAGELLTISRP